MDEQHETSSEDGADLVFEALWKRVLEAWEDDKPHHALLDHAIREQRLPDAAGRYRALVDDPEKGVRAKKKLDGIVIAATQLLFSMKTPARPKVPTAITIVAAIICVGTLVWLAMLLLRQR